MKNSEEKNKYEIIIHGRGGQGAKTTAELLAQTALVSDKFVQAFPEFGPERSGAPLRTFVRVSDKFIRSHEPIVQPDAVLILDDSLLSTAKVNENIYFANVVVVNSSKSIEEIEEILNKNDKFKNQFTGKIIPVDASGIAQKIIGQNRPNTVILGKFAKMNSLINVKDVVTAFEKKYIKRIGKELTEKNVKAIYEASNL